MRGGCFQQLSPRSPSCCITKASFAFLPLLPLLLLLLLLLLLPHPLSQPGMFCEAYILFSLGLTKPLQAAVFPTCFKTHQDCPQKITHLQVCCAVLDVAQQLPIRQSTAAAVQQWGEGTVRTAAARTLHKHEQACLCPVQLAKKCAVPCCYLRALCLQNYMQIVGIIVGALNLP